MSTDNSGIWIWGIHEAGKLAVKHLQSSGQEIKGLIDNSEELCGTEYNGYIINSLDVVRGEIKDCDEVICCCSKKYFSLFKEEIHKGCRANVIHFSDLDICDLIYSNTDDGYEDRFISRLCTSEDFEKPWFNEINSIIPKEGYVEYHRKIWEWVYITKILKDYGMLHDGKRGIGFAVGKEPLPSLFAGMGAHVLASDLAIDEGDSREWEDGNQHASGDIEKLFFENLCNSDEFYERVHYRDIDMNHIPDDEKEYDFCWSSCAIEHVGSLALSKEVVKNSLNTIKSGGIAVHTTEFNLSSNDDTIELGGSVIFRKKDIEELKSWCDENGHHMEVSFLRSKTPMNNYVDIPPYRSEWRPYHLNLALGEYASTSFAIVIQKV